MPSPKGFLPSLWYNNFIMEETHNEDNPDPHLSSPDRAWLKTYIPLFLGESVSLLGSIIVQFAIVWWLTETTGSSTVLASGSIFIMLPGSLFGPFLATLVDRMDRRMLLVVTDAIISLGTIFLVFMFWLDIIEIWHIYLVFGISSIFGNMQWAAVTAVTSSIVPDDQLQRVEGMTVTVQSLFNLAGPVLGAALVSLLPIYGVLSIDVITASIAILLLLTLKIPKVVRHDERAITPSAMWRDMTEGFKFIVAHQGFLYLILVFALFNFFLQPIFTFLPLLVTDYFGKGVAELGYLQSALGLGMVLGGLIMSVWGGFKRKIHTIIFGNLFFGLFIAVIAIASPDMFWLSVIGVLLMSISNPIMNSPILALLQSKVPLEIQGRVFSLAQSLVTLSIPLALGIAGPIAEKTGVHVWYWVSCIGTVAATGLLFLKPIFTLEDQEFNNHTIDGATIVQPTAE